MARASEPQQVAESTAHPMEGRTAVVTGAGRGIGLAVTHRLARAGARVVMIGRDKVSLGAVAESVPNDPVVITADLSEPDAPLAALAQARDAVGAIDVLVNNAGTGWYGPSNEVTPESYEAVFAVNVRATLLLAGHAAADMAANGGGSIINLSSGLSTVGVAGHSLYAAAKAAVDSTTRSLAAEWGFARVRVNSVLLGNMRTEMASPIWADDSIRENYLKGVPLQRIGEPEEAAEVVLFLASPTASYVTGQMIGIDGGWERTAPPIFHEDVARRREMV